MEPQTPASQASDNMAANAKAAQSPFSFRKIIRWILLAFLAGFVVFSFYVMRTPGLRPVVIYPYEEATLKPEEQTHDLGRIPTDVKVHHSFILYNVGGRHLHIQKVETSCGCTVTKLDKTVIAPGHFSKLDVTLDTSIKLGKTVKTIEVYTNDPKHPVYNLTLTATVERQMSRAHNQPVKVKDPLVLFKGECATCHVDKGKGESGEALFMADCAMCHGYDAKGRKDIAPGLLVQNYENAAVMKHMRQVIAEGSPNTPQMPPFSHAKGGPLNDAEIDSLTRYLAFKSKLKLAPTPN